MRTHYRAIAVALALAASTSIWAQQTGTSGQQDDAIFGASRSPQVFGRGFIDNTGIGRPNPNGLVQVTPVPEPSQWAMMVAGLALVGFIVRRNSRKSRDQ